MDITSLRWFNVSSPMWWFRIGGKRINIRLWNLFYRGHLDGSQGRVWGFGILQIGRRHLFCVTWSRMSVLFIGQTE
jgi:hypothetical protein